MARDRLRSLVLAAAIVAVLLSGARSEAGCGCEKPPPPSTPIRPAFASPGAPVTIVADGLVAGEAYVVHFTGWDSGDGVPTADIVGVATVKRDFTDGNPKPQLVVAAPDFAPGPTAMTVTPQAGGLPVLVIPSDDFTILQATLPLDEVQGTTRAKCYRAAIGADGTLFLPLDIAAITERMIFVGRIGGSRVTFGPEDVVIYNTQGVIMQRLDPEATGLYTIDDTNDADADDGTDAWGSAQRSFRMTYDRHEFETYRSRHVSDPDFQLDPSDPDWHVNGTRHTDHDHLVVAIHGLLDRTTPPAPGTTPPVTFRVMTFFADRTNGLKRNTTIKWSAECGHGPPIDPQPVPPEAPTCNSIPIAGCRDLLTKGQARLAITNRVKDGHDRLAWQWKKGQATAVGNFGDPTDTDGFALCGYQEGGSTPLVLQAGVPPNTSCTGNDTKACWKSKGSRKGLRGLLYGNRSGVPDGIDRVALTPGADGRPLLTVQGKGDLLDLPVLPLPLPLHVQLQSATGQCWAATFGPIGLRKNTAEHFLGTSD